MSMKSRHVLASAFALLALSAAACNAPSRGAASAPRAVAEAPASVPTTGSSVAQNVVYSVESDACLKYEYQKIADLNKSPVVAFVVKGKVSAVRDVYAEQGAHRVLTFDVERSFKGKVPARITVYEDGGYVPIKEILPELKEKGVDTERAFTADQIETGVVDFIFMGASHSQIGDEEVLYLIKNPNASQGDSYQIVSSVFGRFKLDRATKRYIRPEQKGTPGFETAKPVGEFEQALTEL